MRRYERASTMLTSNRPVYEWGKLLGDTAAVTALLDRLLHHAHVLKCRPRSWRTRVRTTLVESRGDAYPVGEAVAHPALSHRAAVRTPWARFFPPLSGSRRSAGVLPRRCGAERRIRARPSVNAHPDVVRARESAASRRAWRNNRHRPSPHSPRAPDEPSAALEWSLDATPVPLRRRRPHRPAEPGRSGSRGYPGRALCNHTNNGRGEHRNTDPPATH